jgi:hypothetical protein
MMRASFLLAVALAACASSPAPQAGPSGPSASETEILAAIDRFFLVYATGEADAFEALHAPASTVVIVNEKGEVRRLASADMIARMRAGPPRRIEERYWSPVVQHRGGLATVWAPYSVDVDGKRIHCGIDHFTLTKAASGWLVEQVAFTAEPQACTELEAGTAGVRPQFEGDAP